MSRLKYDYIMLKEICDDERVILLKNYENTYVTRDTRVIGKCIMCDNSFDKSLNKLHKQRNFGCKNCAKKIKFDRIKNTMVDKYGVEYAAQSHIFYDKMKKTNLEKYGVEHANQSEEIKQKVIETNLEKYGVEYSIQLLETQEKQKKTNLEKYGVEHQLHRKEIKEQIKKTNLEKYGIEYPIQSEEVKQKIRQNNLEKYGCEFYTQTEIMKNKTKETNLEKYGVEHQLQRKEIRERIKKTNIEKYGVEHPPQNSEIMEKINKSLYKSKEYKLPSGKIIMIQGYEHFALDELIKNDINENNIVTGAKNVPEIWYYDVNGKKRKHFVDIFVPTLNKCIEVKSTWTLKKQKDIIFLKQNAAKELGYIYEIWVYHPKGNKIEFYN